MEFWAINAVEQNNALAAASRGRERRERIVVFLDPFFGEELRIHEKLRFQLKKLNEIDLPALRR
jgi:hypothetical protein